MPSRVLDRAEEGEERWRTLGMAGGVVVLLVAHTYREEGGEEYMKDDLGAKGDAAGKEDL